MRGLDLHKERNVDKSNQKNEAKNAKPKSVLESLEYIVELVEYSNLDGDFFDKASTHVKYASHKLKLTAMQVVLLAMFVDRSEDSRIVISESARYAGCALPKYCVSQMTLIFLNPSTIFVRRVAVSRKATVFPEQF